ncbi:hypothetical protein [Aneurinibacillus tyrosinisolvens]|uniref:hypothetical protein n=1 Tax=Aneurinibacillus tyrosinisolvens TaxID=1443435 RepID=UPI00128C461C|nr:hypothetical protein [Aneurinibacillus tyrosinisolvens]
MVMLISVLAFSLAILLSFFMAYRYRKERQAVSWLFSGIGGFALLLSGSVFGFIYTHPKPQPSSFLPIKVSEADHSDSSSLIPATSFSSLPQNQPIEVRLISRSQQRDITAVSPADAKPEKKAGPKKENKNQLTPPPPLPKQQKERGTKPALPEPVQSAKAKKETVKSQPTPSETQQPRTPEPLPQEQPPAPSKQNQEQPPGDSTSQPPQPVEQNVTPSQPQSPNPSQVDEGQAKEVNASSQSTEQEKQTPPSPQP